ncbi:MAG: response regulator [Bacteroidales bacterium]|nr:response regulator [Bacteroidales bacterium]
MNNIIENSKSKFHILIVDDDHKSLQVLGSILKQDNYKVDFALDGIEALNWLKREKFDLILLDIVMPRLNGFEVCERIKKDPNTKNIPIIFITSKDDIESTVQGFKLGAVDYITKPFNTDELIIRVGTQLTIKKNHDDLIKFSNELEIKNKTILDSIIYSERIQKAILPGKEEFEKLNIKHFIIYKPKDIISGDFYWIKKTENKLLFAVVDCTGHGVPGAIMSMIGYSAINQAVNEYGMDNPGKILLHMHNFIINSLQKTTHPDNKVNDGMDISLCALDKKNNILEFAGANQSLFLVRNKELTVIKGEKFSIGEILLSINEFKNHKIKLENNDLIYIITDGFSDQFGYESDKRYTIKRLKNFLISISKKSIKEQYNMLENEFKKWKGENEQVDDVTILGIQID